ncbi:MAG: hypothetical protein WBA89_16465 [Microcoleus sp.]|uniref:hypothetical protein n=1 Tax=Microcoleus sp. TaxID=44472 RepID=UPI003C7152DE
MGNCPNLTLFCARAQIFAPDVSSVTSFVRPQQPNMKFLIQQLPSGYGNFKGKRSIVQLPAVRCIIFH